MLIFAIDPGSTESAYCMLSSDAVPRLFAKAPNEVVIQVLRTYAGNLTAVVIERVASYGMPVGREVFDTCEWIGRYTQAASDLRLKVEYVMRQEEKLTICKSPNANDATIRRALIDRFARHDFANGKGTKKTPDFFYGFKADIWSAFAVGITFLDRMEYSGSNNRQ